MKFQCDVEDFRKAINDVDKATSKKGTIPVLAGVKMSLDGNTLTLAGYNLDIGIITQMSVIGEENGEIVTNDGSVLIPALSKLKGNAEVKTAGDSITISSAKASLTFNGMSVNDYPTIPTFEAVNEISGTLLSEAINAVSYAVDENLPRNAYQGAFVKLKDGKCEVVATNGILISKFDFGAGVDGLEATLPKAALKIISDFAGKKDKIKFGLANNQAVFNDGVTEIVTRTLSGDFFNYEKVISSTVDKYSQVSVHRENLREATDLAALLCSKGQKSSPMELNFTANGIETSMQTYNGKSNMYVDCECPITQKMYFNPKLLLEALSHTSAEKVTLHIGGQLMPILIRDDFNYTAVVLPVRKGD